MCSDFFILGPSQVVETFNQLRYTILGRKWDVEHVFGNSLQIYWKFNHSRES